MQEKAKKQIKKEILFKKFVIFNNKTIPVFGTIIKASMKL